jgi:hypothetical protein
MGILLLRKGELVRRRDQYEPCYDFSDDITRSLHAGSIRYFTQAPLFSANTEEEALSGKERKHLFPDREVPVRHFLKRFSAI